MVSRKIIFASLILFLSRPADAGLDLAVIAGPSFANQNISNSAGASTSNETYFSGGPWFNLVFPDSVIGISSGLLFAQSGAKTQSNVFGSAASYDSKTSWLQIPIVLGIWPSEWTSMGLGLYGGAPLTQTTVIGNYTNGQSLLNSSNSNWDFGAVISGQVKIPLGIVSFLLLNALYEFGLSNIDTNGNVVKNNTLLMQVGYGLGF